jgi:hypothetical protein
MQNLRSAITLSTFRGANGADLCITEVHKACYLDAWEQGHLYSLLHDVKFPPRCNEIFAVVVCYAALIGSYWRFGTSCWSQLKKSSGPSKTGPVRCPETSVTANKRCVTSQKNDDRIFYWYLFWVAFYLAPIRFCSKFMHYLSLRCLAPQHNAVSVLVWSCDHRNSCYS